MIIEKVFFEEKKERIIDAIFLKTLSDLISFSNGACKMPNITSNKKDIIFHTEFDEEKKKEFLKQFSSSYRNFNILQDIITIILLNNIIYKCRKKDFDSALNYSLILALKFYGSLLNIFFSKGCIPEIWELSLNSLNGTHLFKVKKGILQAIVFLNKEVFNKYKNLFDDPKLEDKTVVLYVNELRSRLSQSLKSFAEKYYKIFNEKEKFLGKTSKENILSDYNNKNVLSIKLANSFCVYDNKEELILNIAVKKSGSDKIKSEFLLDSLNDPNYQDDIKFLFFLILSLTSLEKNVLKVCNEKSIFFIAGNIMKDVYKRGNYSIKKVIEKLIEISFQEKIDKKEKEKLIHFLAIYILFFFKKKLC